MGWRWADLTIDKLLIEQLFSAVAKLNIYISFIFKDGLIPNVDSSYLKSLILSIKNLP